MIIPIKFDEVDYFKNGFALVRESNGRTGFINKKGEITYIRKNLLYDLIGDVSEGLYRVNIRGKEGYLNLKGKVVIPFKYDYAEEFREGLAKVEKNGKYGFINKKGKVVVPIKYEEVRGFQRGIAAVKKNGKWGFVNKRGKVVIPFIYDNAYSRAQTAYGVQRFYSAKNPAPTSWSVSRYKEGWKEIDEKGAVLFVHPDHVYSPEKLSFINKEGKKVDLSDYIYADLFEDGRCLVQGKNGKWGYIDDNGNPITNLEYDIDYYTGNGFHDGVAMVYKDGKYGFIDREGKVVVPIKYGIFR